MVEGEVDSTHGIWKGVRKGYSCQRKIMFDPGIERKVKTQWKGVGRDICYDVFMQAAPAD